MNVVRRIRDGLGPPPPRAAMAVATITALLAAAVFLGRGPAVPAAALREQFLAAGRAYDAGRMREAAQLYGALVRRGYASAEVFFNLGNAEARDGRSGAAVLAYRKAWRLAPRDPDVAANLRLALRSTGASEADLSAAELFFTLLSEREWGTVATASWWAACVLVALGILIARRRPFLLRLAALPVASALVALIALATWRGFDRLPELVVLADTVNVLRAPQPAAAPHFSLPEGSLVRAREFRGEWVEVSHGQLSGWVRRGACAPVLLAGPPA